MLNNFKNWIHNTAIAIVDDTDYKKSEAITPTLKLNSNLTQSTSSLVNGSRNKTSIIKTSRTNNSNGNSHNDSQSISEIDLSNLSREEKEHIEYVIKKAEEDFIMSENFLEMKRKSKTNSDIRLNTQKMIDFKESQNKNKLAPTNLNAKYSSSTSSLSSMSSCFSQNDHQTTSTPDEPNKSIKFNSNDSPNQNSDNSLIEPLKFVENHLEFKPICDQVLLNETSHNKKKNDNNYLEGDKQQKTRAKRRLPSTPSFINSSTNNIDKITNNKTSCNMTSLPAQNQLNLDTINITEWLKKSLSNQNNAQTSINTASTHLTNSKQQLRRNSASNVRVIVDEPLIEINLSRHYCKKQDSISSNNLVSDSYQQYSKSQTYISKDISQMYLIDPNDDIKKVFIYKDPKELTLFKSSTNTLNDDKTTTKSNQSRRSSTQKERRPSVSLGLEIVSKQLSELNEMNSENENLGAIITSIEPDGLIEKFNVSINEGDEIVEICGVNLRNKSDSQIDEILDETCKKNNGEIELLVRRSHSLRKKNENKNETNFSSSTNSNYSTDNNLFNKKKEINSKAFSINNNFNNKSIINNVKYNINDNDIYDASRGFNEISIKKKGTRPREQLIADPALLLSIRNKRNDTQSRSFSPNINRPKIRPNNDTIMPTSPVITTIKSNIKSLVAEAHLTSQDNDLFKKHNNAFETKRTPKNLRNTNSPVALDEFRALRDSKINTKSTDNGSKTSNNVLNQDLNGLDYHEQLIRKSSDGSGYSNTCLSNSSSKDENVSVFSFNSNPKSAFQQINHIQISNFKLDEKSSGYNSNQSTPTSEPNSIRNQSTTSNTTSMTKLEIDSILAKSKSKSFLFGEIQIQLSHDDVRNELIVRVLKARNLISKDSNGFSDPYCKLYLLPGRESENKRRTKTVFKSLNPIWNETFIYTNIYREEVFNKTLEFTLYDWDRFSRDDFLGILKLDLKDPNYLDNSPRWFALEDLPNVNTISDADNTRTKRDFKSRLSFKRSKSLRRSSYK